MALEVEDIEKAVAALPADGYRKFRRWFLDRDWQAWDESIEADSDAGKLDFLLTESRAEKNRHRIHMGLDRLSEEYDGLISGR